MNQEQALFDEAAAHQAQGNYAKAIACYKDLLTKIPAHPEALHLLGLTLAQKGEMQEALFYLEQALATDRQNASLYHHLGTVYKHLGLGDKAKDAFHQALSLAPEYAQAHNNLAILYTANSCYQEALRHYMQAVHAAPDFTAAHYNLGLLFLKMANKAAALTQFNNVLALDSEHAEANFYKGVLLLEDNQLDEAKVAFQQVLNVFPEHIEALCNRGTIALKQDQGQLAIEYFTKALALDNQYEHARNNLAATFMHYDRFENALTHYQVLLERFPENNEYYYNAGVAEMVLGQLEKALAHFENILSRQQNHAASLANMAAIYLKWDKRLEAKAFLERAHAANPEDESTKHLLNAFNGDKTKTAANPEYAKNLFDNYALYYDSHMQDKLQYSLPQYIRHLVQNLPLAANKTLDLGCGTGLAGEALRGISHTLIGVDLAPKMLAKAKAKSLYDQLICTEIITYFNENQETYDLIAAADVLPYFGELEPLFQKIASHLQPAGSFIFSTEISKEPDWHLQTSARFSHHPDYIINLCKTLGFQILSQEIIPARLQDNQALPVLLWMVRLLK